MNSYSIEPIKRQSIEGKMVFGKWTTGNPRTVGYRLCRNDRPIATYDRKRDAQARIEREQTAERKMRDHAEKVHG